mmetsp:Transcript_21641/g.43749  ORF Transcript_21641/g.43749 Transcript_21641/m.43749 type:complete len:88 (+) Transcript_21641:211-474(+)
MAQIVHNVSNILKIQYVPCFHGSQQISKQHHMRIRSRKNPLPQQQSTNTMKRKKAIMAISFGPKSLAPYPPGSFLWYISPVSVSEET